MNSQQIRKIISDTIETWKKHLIDLSLKIHQHPELSNQESQAHDWLTDALETQFGFTVTRSAYGLKTAFIAEAGPKDAPVLGFCCEYDALPELGHACGHNLIAMIGVACAIACKQVQPLVPFPFCIRVYGTPAEETTGGKLDLIQCGAFRDAKLVLMAHPGPEHVICGNWLAYQGMTIDYFGKAAHASAAPWYSFPFQSVLKWDRDGINALDAAVSAYTSISHLRHQMHSNDRVHGIIRNGGQAPNIIPDHTSMEYYVRSPTFEGLNSLVSRVEACFESAAKSSGCRLQIQKDRILKDVKSHPVLASFYQQEMAHLGVTLSLESLDTVPRGSTDMGNVSHQVPGLHPLFAVSNAPMSFTYHTKEFQHFVGTMEAQESALRTAKALAMTGLLSLQHFLTN